MRYLAAYLLSALSGNKEPSVDEISTILGSVGIEVDEERAKKVVSELKGKDLSQVISEGIITISFLRFINHQINTLFILKQEVKNLHLYQLVEVVLLF